MAGGWSTPATVVVVTGLPGAGKSRLVDGMAGRLTSEGLRVLTVDWAGAPFARMLAVALKSDEVTRGWFFTRLWAATVDALFHARWNYDVILVERWGFDIAFYHGASLLPHLKLMERFAPDAIVVVEGGGTVSDEGIEPVECKGRGVVDCYERLMDIVSWWVEESYKRIPVINVGTDAREAILKLREVGVRLARRG